MQEDFYLPNFVNNKVGFTMLVNIISDSLKDHTALIIDHKILCITMPDPIIISYILTTNVYSYF